MSDHDPCSVPGLIDERHDPPLRTVIGSLLGGCSHASIALGNVRLAMIDLDEGELSGVEHCRILLGRLDARALGAAGPADATTQRHAGALLDFIGSDRVEIRSAGLSTWTPDFSVYLGRAGIALPVGTTPTARTALIGAHWFREPAAAGGPSFTVSTSDAAAVDLALSRFDELWQGAYDIRTAVLDAVRAWSLRG
jgi:hypothetical protein